MDVNSPTSPKRAATAERRQKAVMYRIGGKTYEEIGQLLEISKQAAHQLVVGALKDNAEKVAENVDELRRLELERLDFMRNALWSQVIKGDLGAIDRALRISKRMSELTGIDAPTKIAPTDPRGEKQYEPIENVDQVAQRIEQLLKLAQARRDADKDAG